MCNMICLYLVVFKNGLQCIMSWSVWECGSIFGLLILIDTIICDVPLDWETGRRPELKAKRWVESYWFNVVAKGQPYKKIFGNLWCPDKEWVQISVRLCAADSLCKPRVSATTGCQSLQSGSDGLNLNSVAAKRDYLQGPKGKHQFDVVSIFLCCYPS